ncbi:MAG: redox-regulated ATPase YchF [Buchnera aphidicola (Chaetogeoica yunlongensis)]
MEVKFGLVGLPNVGKSTIFNVLTRLKIPAENFPFCTIKPNIGKVPIFDSRLFKLSKIVLSDKVIPIIIELVDIAGLVKNAHKGEGLGNQFLDHIKDTNVILHVVRCFKNDNVTHIYGKIEPIQDINVINLELILADLEVCHNRLIKLKKINLFDTNSKIKKEILMLKRFIDHLERNRSLRSLNLTTEDFFLVNHLRLITLKPMIYILNMNRESMFNNIYEKETINFIRGECNAAVVKIFLDEMNDILQDNLLNKNTLFSKKNIINEKLNEIFLLGFHSLNLVTFFTAGSKEVRAWITTKNSFIYKSVKCIHSDFSRGFIRAQIISYCDFIKYGDKQSKKLGKMKTVGKKYFICDGDIVYVLYKV